MLSDGTIHFEMEFGVDMSHILLAVIEPIEVSQLQQVERILEHVLPNEPQHGIIVVSEQSELTSIINRPHSAMYHEEEKLSELVDIQLVKLDSQLK